MHDLKEITFPVFPCSVILSMETITAHRRNRNSCPLSHNSLTLILKNWLLHGLENGRIALQNRVTENTYLDSIKNFIYSMQVQGRTC